MEHGQVHRSAMTLSALRGRPRGGKGKSEGDQGRQGGMRRCTRNRLEEGRTVLRG
jgi:hypothetical protein